jgi:hypothetical protein
MLRDNRLIWYVGIIALFLLAAMIFQLTRDARLRRRRRKSHGRIVAKAKRPMVRFSVRPPKE